MSAKNGLFASFFFLGFGFAFCREYTIDSMRQVPFAFNDAIIASDEGFVKPVFLFAEFTNGNEALVFRTEKLNFTEEIIAKYYSQGSIIALSLYLDAEKQTLLKRQELPQPAVMQIAAGKISRGMEFDITPALNTVSKFKPRRYISFILYLAGIFFAALLSKKSQATASASPAGTIILFTVILTATVMILLYSEKPGIIEITAPSIKTSGLQKIMEATEDASYLRITVQDPENKFSGNSRLILQSCGSRRFPLACLSGFHSIMFDEIPVIELSANREYFLRENTNQKAWTNYE